jgi:hypothetical protein
MTRRRAPQAIRFDLLAAHDYAPDRRQEADEAYARLFFRTVLATGAAVLLLALLWAAGR